MLDSFYLICFRKCSLPVFQKMDNGIHGSLTWCMYVSFAGRL